MELDPVDESEKWFAHALDNLACGNSQAALADLERALKLNDNRSWYSYLGYCIAKERGQVKKGSELCAQSLELEPEQSGHYLNLARIHILCDHKPEAIEVLRKGLSATGCPEILVLLNELGSRKPPVFSFLSRDSWLNRYVGLIATRLNLR